MLVAERPEGSADLSDEDQARLTRQARFTAELSGYLRLQSTRPQTVAYGLTDSPVGQLAWIAEKFREWTDPASAINRDQVLTNVMLYWLTATAGSSARLYYEYAKSGTFGPPPPTTTPTGVAVFAHDIVLPIRRQAERVNNIVHWSEFDRGGHFAAMDSRKSR